MSASRARRARRRVPASATARVCTAGSARSPASLAPITCETGTSGTCVRYEPQASRSELISWPGGGPGKRENSSAPRTDGHAGAAIDLVVLTHRVRIITCEVGSSGMSHTQHRLSQSLSRCSQPARTMARTRQAAVQRTAARGTNTALSSVRAIYMCNMQHGLVQRCGFAAAAVILNLGSRGRACELGQPFCPEVSFDCGHSTRLISHYLTRPNYAQLKS